MRQPAQPSRHAANPRRDRKPQSRASARQVHWIGQMVVGVAPRAWLIRAANDPQA